MKRTGGVLALALAMSLAACGGPTGSPTAPAARSASPVVFSADLGSGLPAGDPEATCKGRVTITLDPTRRPPLDRLTAKFEVALNSCPASTRITEAHVHAGPAGVAGAGIRMDALLGTFDLVNGAGATTTTNAGIEPRTLEEIAVDPGGFHFHVHSERHPNGFLRGQLRAGG